MRRRDFITPLGGEMAWLIYAVAFGLRNDTAQ
jgi:hypothetical protein